MGGGPRMGLLLFLEEVVNLLFHEQVVGRSGKLKFMTKGLLCHPVIHVV